VTIADLILDALDKGYDVTVTVRSRTDGKSGKLIVPKNWRDIQLRRLNITSTASRTRLPLRLADGWQQVGRVCRSGIQNRATMTKQPKLITREP